MNLIRRIFEDEARAITHAGATGDIIDCRFKAHHSLIERNHCSSLEQTVPGICA